MIVQDAFRIGLRGPWPDKLSGETPLKKIDIPARTVMEGDLDSPERKTSSPLKLKG